MDLEVEGKDIGRLDFELFGNAAPKTVNNFLGFVTGRPVTQNPRSYSDDLFALLQYCFLECASCVTDLKHHLVHAITLLTECAVAGNRCALETLPCADLAGAI